MAAWTLEQARQHLKSWMDAELSVSTGQWYKIGTRELTRADLNEVAKRIQFWSNEVTRLEKGRKAGARVLRVVPRDL